MPDTLPNALTPGIRAFCRKVAVSDPVLVRCRPERGAVPSECFDNVAGKAARACGSVTSG